MNEIDKIKEMINKRYKKYATGWTYERSQGNYCDCFDDGYESGYANALYEIGMILNMDLEYEYPEDEDLDY